MAHGVELQACVVLLIVVSLSLSRMGALLVEVQCIQMLFISVVMTDLSCEAHLGYNVRQMELGAKQQAFAKLRIAVHLPFP